MPCSIAAAATFVSIDFGIATSLSGEENEIAGADCLGVCAD